MNRLYYIKSDPKGLNINEFVLAARKILLQDRNIFMILEPGDATRYEMAIIDGHGEFIFTGLSGFNLGVGFKLSKMCVQGPWHFGEVNPNSAALAADICNMVLSIDNSKYYDFVEGHMIDG